MAGNADSGHPPALLSLFTSKHPDPHLERILRQGPQRNLPVCRNFFGKSTSSRKCKVREPNLVFLRLSYFSVSCITKAVISSVCNVFFLRLLKVTSPELRDGGMLCLFLVLLLLVSKLCSHFLPAFFTD